MGEEDLTETRAKEAEILRLDKDKSKPKRRGHPPFELALSEPVTR